MNRFSIKPNYISGTNNNNHINPFRIKRTYNMMLEQDHCNPLPVMIGTKRLKQSETSPAESLVKYERTRIPERIKREIELYNYERRGYNFKIKPCSCDN